MLKSFSLEAISKKAGKNKGKNRDLRSLQHKLIVDFLDNYGVKSKMSSRLSEAMKHIEKGEAIVISAHVHSKTDFEPEFSDDWNAEVSILDDRLSSGTTPIPNSLWMSEGAHAVAGIATIPPTGRFSGKRILVLDTLNNAVNIWSQGETRIASSKFILIYSNNTKKAGE